MNTLALYFSMFIFSLLPTTRCFGLKRGLLRLSGAKIGQNVRICSNVRIYGNGQLIVGDNTWIGHGTTIICSERIEIGKNVNIAPLCYIGTGTHEICPHTESVAGKGYSLPIKVGDGCWLCARSTLIAGCSIGERTVVAAGGGDFEQVIPFRLHRRRPSRSRDKAIIGA